MNGAVTAGKGHLRFVQTWALNPDQIRQLKQLEGLVRVYLLFPHSYFLRVMLVVRWRPTAEASGGQNVR